MRTSPISSLAVGTSTRDRGAILLQPSQMARNSRYPCASSRIFAWLTSIKVGRNSRKFTSSILHMRRYRDNFWSSEAWMRREGDHNITWAWIHIHGYECDFRG